MTNRTRLSIIVGCVLLIATASGGLWILFSGWPPIVLKNRSYQELLSAFQNATIRDRIKSSSELAGWDFWVQSGEPPTQANVLAYRRMSVVRIKYPDEDAERALYEYNDYSHPVEIRTTGSTLYVYWTETLLGTTHWILSYDVTKRREVIRRRIDYDDLKNRGSSIRTAPRVSTSVFTRLERA